MNFKSMKINHETKDFIKSLEEAKSILLNNNRCDFEDYRIYPIFIYNNLTEEQRRQAYKYHGDVGVYFLKFIFKDGAYNQELYPLKNDGSLEKYEQGKDS